MSKSGELNSQEVCEDILHKWKHNNDGAWLNADAIVDRMLSRRSELNDAYRELFNKLTPKPKALDHFLDFLILAADEFNSDYVQKARENFSELEVLNNKIAKYAQELSVMLAQRVQLEAASGFTSQSQFHVIDVIESSSIGNGLYQSFLKDDLASMRARFDLKYWPSLSEFVRVLSEDASNADVVALDPAIALIAESKRSSKADFFRILFSKIEEWNSAGCPYFPSDFQLTDKTLASLANVVLDIDAEELCDAAYVKSLRHRLIHREKSNEFSF